MVLLRFRFVIIVPRRSIDRRPYVAPQLDVQHFCTFQQPPCQRNDCRVATQIIAGLYPMNFSKFLITTYEPMHDDDSKGMMHFHLAFLLRKLCTENGQVNSGGTGGTGGTGSGCTGPMPSTSNGSSGSGHVSLSELLRDVDDSDNAMLCKIGSAFTECYLSENALPVSELLKECFVMRPGVDIDLNVLWLEVMYADQQEELAEQERNAAECTIQLHHDQRQQHETVAAASDGGCSSSKRKTQSQSSPSSPSRTAAKSTSACSSELEDARRARELCQLFSERTSTNGMCLATARQKRMASMLGIQELNERLAEESMALSAEADAITLTDPFLEAAVRVSAGPPDGQAAQSVPDAPATETANAPTTTATISAEQMDCAVQIAATAAAAAVAAHSGTSANGKGSDHLAEAIKLAVNQKLNL